MGTATIEGPVVEFGLRDLLKAASDLNMCKPIHLIGSSSPMSPDYWRDQARQEPISLHDRDKCAQLPGVTPVGNPEEFRALTTDRFVAVKCTAWSDISQEAAKAVALRERDPS